MTEDQIRNYPAIQSVTDLKYAGTGLVMVVGAYAGFWVVIELVAWIVTGGIA